MLTYFGVDLEDVQANEYCIIKKEVNGIDSVVFVSKGKGSMPIPLGCSAISLPKKICTDDYHFAALFLPSQPITQPDPKLLFQCIAEFLPTFMELKLTFPFLSLHNFQAGPKKYQLALQTCDLVYDSTLAETICFLESLQTLLPGNKRFEHATSNVQRFGGEIRHPVLWSEKEGLYWLVDFVASTGHSMEIPDLDRMVQNGNWASHPRVREDVDGTDNFWKKRPGMKRPKYTTSLFTDLCRYLRNKLLHFSELDGHLRAAFDHTTSGLLSFCNRQVKGGDLIFLLWERIDKGLTLGTASSDQVGRRRF